MAIDGPTPGVPFDLSDTVVHLGTGSTTVPLSPWSWTAEQLAAYDDRFAAEDEGRLLSVVDQPSTWTTWERHPAGEELVLLLSGRVDLVLEDPTAPGVPGPTIELVPGTAVVVPRNTWHTADVHAPGQGIFVTPGRGTEHRPR